MGVNSENPQELPMPIKLIHHQRANVYAFTWVVGRVTFLQTGFALKARAIAAANDLCAHLGTVPKFVR